jgi:membrane-bound lytic murein transglycosylase D
LRALIHLLAAAAVLWLAGCATPIVSAPPSAPPVLSPIVVQAAAPPTPIEPVVAPAVYPLGSLKPLANTSLGSNTVHPLLPPADMWDRIRRGFAMPDLDNDLVRERELWYSSRPDYIARMTERGSKYLFYIVEELERRNMPSELALLPFIESAFNPQAVSSAKAAGMWQFMPATGRSFDLKQNMFRDDRRDVLASTRAALDYLQKLYGMFGDWHLALAAYNWGEGNVQRAINKANRTHSGTGYPELGMPMETRLYVPKLQAVKNIIANPENFRVTLPDIENHPYFQTVDIRRDIDVALAAKFAEVSLDDFRALNPSVTKPVLLASGTPQILLPWDSAERFQNNLETYTGGRLANWTAWIAPSTLKPADAAKRVGMSEAELRSVNQIPSQMLIRAGSTMLLHRPPGMAVDVSERIADTGQLSLSPDRVPQKTTIKAGKKETVTSLAQRYKLSPQDVASWNKLSATSALKPGQMVVLYLIRPNKANPSKSTRHAPARKKVGKSVKK